MITTQDGAVVDSGSIQRIEFHPSAESLVGELARIYFVSGALGGQSGGFATVSAIADLGKLRELAASQNAGFALVNSTGGALETYARGNA
jgi:hypothetical protein